MGNIVQDLFSNIKQLEGTTINPIGAVKDVFTTVPSVSQEVLNAMAPDNYELYDCTIQIVRSATKGRVPALVAQFDFNILPDALEVPHKYRTNILSTIYRNFILDSEFESPAQFSLTGNFGLNHKLILNVPNAERQEYLKGDSNISPFKSSAQARVGSLRNVDDPKKKLLDEFVSKFVTGYGLCKRLEKLVALSHQSDATTGLPYKTYLVSKAFNTSMRIEIMAVSFKQTIQKNRIWQYDLTIQKVEDDTSPFYTTDNLQETLINKVMNNVLGKNISTAGNQLFALIGKYI